MEFSMKDRIIFLREKYGYTQETVSQLIGIKRATYAKYENGQAKNIPNAVVLRLAQIYKVSTDYLYSLDTEKNARTYKFSDASRQVTNDEMKFVSAIRLVSEEKRDEVFGLILKYANSSEAEPLRKDTDEE